MGIDFSRPNSSRDPLELLEETECWLIGEASAIERQFGNIPLAERMRGRVSYIRGIRLAIAEKAEDRTGTAQFNM